MGTKFPLATRELLKRELEGLNEECSPGRISDLLCLPEEARFKMAGIAQYLAQLIEEFEQEHGPL